MAARARELLIRRVARVHVCLEDGGEEYSIPGVVEADVPIVRHGWVGAVTQRRVVVEELATAVAAKVISNVPAGFPDRAGATRGSVAVG
jgi:hypothetical protein